MTTALVIVDVQRGPLRETSALRGVAERIVEFVRTRREAYATTIATAFRNDPGSTYDRLIGDDLRVDADVAVIDELAELVDHVCDAPTYSSLTPSVQQLLVGSGAREVHVVGIDTDQCVLATVLALFDAGFEPVVFDDLVASASGVAPHEAGLLILRRAIGEDRVRSALP